MSESPGVAAARWVAQQGIKYRERFGKEPMSDMMWWGYLHSNGTIQVKVWFGDHADYIDDCVGNPFVVRVVPPFHAANREEALEHIRLELSR